MEFKMLLAIRENKMHEVLNARILSLYRPSYMSKMFIKCSSMNEPTQTLTSQLGVGVILITIKGGHGK